MSSRHEPETPTSPERRTRPPMRTYDKTGVVSLGVMFIMMCGLKLWYALPLFFAFAFVLTAIRGKRSYCGGICPLGRAESRAHRKSGRVPAEPPAPWIRNSVFVLFWSFLIGTLQNLAHTRQCCGPGLRR